MGEGTARAKFEFGRATTWVVITALPENNEIQRKKKNLLLPNMGDSITLFARVFPVIMRGTRQNVSTWLLLLLYKEGNFPDMERPSWYGKLFGLLISSILGNMIFFFFHRISLFLGSAVNSSYIMILPGKRRSALDSL